MPIDRDQVRYALERQARFLEDQASQLADQLDYRAEYPDADAKCLREAIVLLSAPPVSDAQIREVFMANGFTIKEGQTDLKPYVYAAARALLALAAITANDS